MVPAHKHYFHFKKERIKYRYRKYDSREKFMKKLVITILTIACLVACKNQVSEPDSSILNRLNQISYIKHNQIKSSQSEQITIGQAIVDDNIQETAI